MSSVVDFCAAKIIKMPFFYEKLQKKMLIFQENFIISKEMSTFAPQKVEKGLLPKHKQ